MGRSIDRTAPYRSGGSRLRRGGAGGGTWARCLARLCGFGARGRGACSRGAMRFATYRRRGSVHAPGARRSTRQEHRGAAEQQVTPDAGEEQTAERVQIGALVDRFAQDLFGCHALQAARPFAGGGEPGGAGFEEGGDAEVEDLGHAVGTDDDVAALEVAVDDVAGVHGAEDGGDLHPDRSCFLDAQLLLFDDPVLEVDTGRVLHDQEPCAAFLAEVVDGGDASVVEARGGAGPWSFLVPGMCRDDKGRPCWVPGGAQVPTDGVWRTGPGVRAPVRRSRPAPGSVR